MLDWVSKYASNLDCEINPLTHHDIQLSEDREESARVLSSWVVVVRNIPQTSTFSIQADKYATAPYLKYGSTSKVAVSSMPRQSALHMLYFLDDILISCSRIFLSDLSILLTWTNEVYNPWSYLKMPQKAGISAYIREPHVREAPFERENWSNPDPPRFVHGMECSYLCFPVKDTAAISEYLDGSHCDSSPVRKLCLANMYITCSFYGCHGWFCQSTQLQNEFWYVSESFSR